MKVTMDEVKKIENDMTFFNQEIIITDAEILTRKLENIFNGIFDRYKNSEAYITYQIYKEKEAQLIESKNKVL